MVDQSSKLLPAFSKLLGAASCDKDHQIRPTAASSDAECFHHVQSTSSTDRRAAATMKRTRSAEDNPTLKITRITGKPALECRILLQNILGLGRVIPVSFIIKLQNGHSAIRRRR